MPYSEHSSFPVSDIQPTSAFHLLCDGSPLCILTSLSHYQELVDCIACLKPVKVIPTVSVSKSDDQVKLLLSKQD